MNKGVYVVQNGKLKKVITSGYGDGLVKTVNGIEPDQRGDVDLGEIASPTDVEVAKDNAIKTARDLAKVDMEMATEGIRGFMHRGVWASGVEYEKNNLVIYNESVYQAVKDIKDNEKEKEPETEVEDNENIEEVVATDVATEDESGGEVDVEAEDSAEPTEPSEEHNPVEVNPEDKEHGYLYWRMFAPKTKERPRGTYAEAVNGIVPDETGNVDLGQIASIDDVEYGMNEAIKGSNNYTDEQIEKIKEEGIGGGDVSTEDLDKAVGEAKDHANQVAGDARVEANQYTDGEIKKVKEDTKVIVSDVLKDYPELHLATRPPTDSDNWMGLWGVYTASEDPNVKTLSELEFGETIDTGILVPPELNINLSEPTILAKKIGEDTYGQKEVTIITDFLPLKPFPRMQKNLVWEEGVFYEGRGGNLEGIYSSYFYEQPIDKLLPNLFWLYSDSLNWYEEWVQYMLDVREQNFANGGEEEAITIEVLEDVEIKKQVSYALGKTGFGAWLSPEFKNSLMEIHEYTAEGKLIKRSWGLPNKFRLNKNNTETGGTKRAYGGLKNITAWSELFSTDRYKEDKKIPLETQKLPVESGSFTIGYNNRPETYLPTLVSEEGAETPIDKLNPRQAFAYSLPHRNKTSRDANIRYIYTTFHMKPTTLVRKQANGRWKILDSSIQEVEITRLFARKQK